MVKGMRYEERLPYYSERRLYHSEQAEALLAGEIDITSSALAQAHALLAIFYQGEARDIGRGYSS